MVVSLQFVQLHGFLGSEISFTILFHHAVLDTGVPQAMSAVKLLRELKTRRQICWYRMVSCSDPVSCVPPSWWLGAWCAVAKKSVSYVNLWRADESASIRRLRLGVSPWLGKWSVVAETLSAV